MSLPKQIAKHFREVYFGGNWTSVNLRETLSGVNWQQANQKMYNLHTIGELVYHIHYYVKEVLKVLEGATLQASDKYSFDLAPITSEDDWQLMLSNTWKDGERFAARMEALDGHLLFENFQDPKYGIYYRNLTGIIEHAHYHLGQIVLIRKMINSNY